MMIHNIWNAFLFQPFVNLLAFILKIIPGGDLGVAVIVLTLIVKSILYPLSQKSIVNQAKMNLLNPEIEKIKNSGLSKEEQAKLTFDLYRKHKTNPFSGCLLIFIQIPIIFALYYVFYKGLSFDNNILYSFVSAPTNINHIFLGLIDLSGKSLILAIFAGISQFLQAHYMPKPSTSGKEGSFSDNLAKSMQVQMKYVLPIIIVFIAYSISGAVALYWITSNMFAVVQQIMVNKKRVSITVDGEKLKTTLN